MGIASCKDYWARYKQPPGLPSNPGQFYGDEYKGWGDFTGHSRFYLAVDEARRAVITLGIKTWPEYKKRYKEDPKLPSDPASFYGETYRGFTEYSGQTKSDRYATMAEASAAAVRMEMKSSMDYRARFHQNPFLPSDPPAYFSGEWKNWAFFLKVDNAPRAGKGKYDTYESFVVAVRNLNITSQVEYKARYKEDSKLPGHPHAIYKKDWISWPEVFGVSPYLKRCSTWEEAKVVAAPYRFTTRAEYQDGCSADDRLPKYPTVRHKDFPGWLTFLLSDNFTCLDDVRCAVKILGIKSSARYRSIRSKYPMLPAHPDRKFFDEWVDWYDLCNIPRPYSYNELQELVGSHECTTIRDYKELMAKLEDPRIPSSPEEVYSEWQNWHVFLGKPEPYTFSYIKGCGVGWIPSVQNWLKSVKAQPGKETNICRFIRHFVEPYDLGRTPREFLTRKSTDIKPFKVLMESQASRQIGRSMLLAVNAYLDSVLKNELTIEDEDTGELVRVEGASNPFATLEFKGDGTPGPREILKKTF